MHPLLIAIGTLLLVASLLCVFLASNQYWQLQFDINDRLPEGEKFKPASWLSFPTGSWSRFKELQRRVLPDSPRLRRGRRFAWSGLALLVCSIVVFFLAYTHAAGLTGQ